MAFKITVQNLPPKNDKFSDTIYEQIVEELDLVALVSVVNGITQAK